MQQNHIFAEKTIMVEKKINNKNMFFFKNKYQQNNMI